MTLVIMIVRGMPQEPIRSSEVTAEHSTKIGRKCFAKSRETRHDERKNS